MAHNDMPSKPTSPANAHLTSPSALGIHIPIDKTTLSLVGGIVVALLLSFAFNVQDYSFLPLMVVLYQVVKWRFRRSNPLKTPTSPVELQRRKKSRLVALAATVFAFSPLIVTILFPMSDTATHEGADMRPIFSIVTLPLGIGIALIALAIGKKKPHLPE